jgi:hypothetical protein
VSRKFWKHHLCGTGHPYRLLWGWIVVYGWGFDVKFPWCWLTYSKSLGRERSHCYVSPDATPNAAWFFLWGRRYT